MNTKQQQQPEAPSAPEEESGVQLSRQALYERRLAEIAADFNAGRCTSEEAGERLAQAVLALYARLLTPKGREVALQRLRARVASDPELRKIFG